MCTQTCENASHVFFVHPPACFCDGVNLRLIDAVRLVNPQALEILLPLPLSIMVSDAHLLLGAENLNPGPHACIASASELGLLTTVKGLALCRCLCGMWGYFQRRNTSGADRNPECLFVHRGSDENLLKSCCRRLELKIIKINHKR